MLDRPLLITTAINPPEGLPFLKMISPQARLLATKAAIFFWSLQGVKNMVVADATNSLPLSNDDVAQLNALGVSFEQICYQQVADLVIEKGKGFGEGELINFALHNSKILFNADAFLKCTGKLYCRNANELLRVINAAGTGNLFWRHLEGMPHSNSLVDTRLYSVRKSFFYEKVYPLYNACNDHVTSIEYEMFSMLESTLPRGQAVRPLLAGFSGGTGEYCLGYNLGYLDQHAPCWGGHRAINLGLLTP